MVSIIIPAHNEEAIIEKTLRSIPPGNQIIVVCNGCADNTEKIAKTYATVITTKEAHVSKARNLGASYANEDKLIFLDADTQITQEVIPSIKKTLDNHSLGTCKGIPNEHQKKHRMIIAIKNRLLHCNWSSGIIFCTRSLFQKIKGFNENLTKKETGDFIRRGRRYGSFVVIDAPVIHSMRRFKAWGIPKTAYYWIKEYLVSSDKKYPVIR